MSQWVKYSNPCMCGLPPQVSLSRQVDEASARVASLEASLAAAREEGRQAAHKAEAAAQQLVAAEDAIKVGCLCARGSESRWVCLGGGGRGGARCTSLKPQLPVVYS